MDQGRLRVGRRRLAAELIDLGNEPPLSVDGGSGGLVDRRRFSVRWLSGTILTGLCGAALMGGAVFASLDGETNFAAAPQRVETALRGALSSLGDHLTGPHKTDRLPALGKPGVEREVFRVPTITRGRDRETVRVRTYERVLGNLSLTVSDISEIPPFNPQKILAAAVAGDDQSAAPEPDAEVSFSTCDFVPAPRAKVTPASCDLNSLLPHVKRSTLLPIGEVMERVRDAANAGAAGTPQIASAGDTSMLKLSYAADSEPDADFPFELRVVPENVTLLPKTTASDDDGDRIITVKKGETVGSILRELGANPDEIQEIIAVLGQPAKEGQKLRVLLAPAGLGHMQPLRVIVVADSSIVAAAALSDTGRYVAVDTRNVDTEVVRPSDDNDQTDEGGGISLYQSLYGTALRNHVPNAVIEEMLRIFAYNVDFERKVQPGDSFDVLYAEERNDEGTSEVRYASLTAGGETKKYYHFQSADDGMYDYYDETGKSAEKFLVRKPVPTGVITSPFGWRIHPLLFFREFHTGDDWGAPLGTPIFAAGNGTIEEIGPKGGYGKYVRIRHADGYETAYSHLTAFARGLDVGSRVRQGQIIGFVGSTGISTGPHVLFEILLNGHYVDPMRVKLPRGRVLDGGTLAQFENDRNQLDALINKPGRDESQSRPRSAREGS
ncbi:MAG TPA: M23 family metallopeptidase [Xanthobacteraceae bacterium]|nr:M23 family metallopeptidase [Xanthobacteraceae bacterium]